MQMQSTSIKMPFTINFPMRYYANIICMVLLSNFKESARFKMSRDICLGGLLEDRSLIPTSSKYTSGLKSL